MLMALIACATEQTYSDLEVAGTVEAAIEEKLAEISKVTPTATPVPMDAQYLAILSKWDPQSRWGPEYREILYVQLVGQWLLATGMYGLQPRFYDWALSKGKDAWVLTPWEDLSNSWELGLEIGSGNGVSHPLENRKFPPALFWHLRTENPDIDNAIVGITMIRMNCGEIIRGAIGAEAMIRGLTEMYEKHKYATIMEKGNPASFLPKFESILVPDC